MKLQSAAQRKQLEYLRPYLCRWASDTGDGSDISAKHSINSGQERCESKNVNESVQKCVATSKNSQPIRNAGRCRAAPHIKTYIRFSDANLATIDWAMVTSANLSVQAWGAAANGKKEIRICSWEIGVLVWPDLFIDREVEKDGGGTGRNGKENGKELPRDDGNKNNGYNKPAAVMLPCFKQDMPEVPEDNGSGASTTSTFVGLRMPYDLPLSPYTPQDQPWCATVDYNEPDWLGQTWEEEK